MAKLKRGVSPVVATLLLILISIAAAALIYAFVAGYIGRTEQQTGQAQSQIIIEAASIRIATQPQLNVTVRNAGGNAIPAGNWTFYVYNATSGILLAYNTTYVSATIQPNAPYIFTNLTLVNSTALTTGQLYDVKAVSPLGTFDIIRIGS